MCPFEVVRGGFRETPRSRDIRDSRALVIACIGSSRSPPRKGTYILFANGGTPTITINSEHTGQMLQIDGEWMSLLVVGGLRENTVFPSDYN